MKKCFIIILLLSSVLSAYNLDMGGLGAYTNFDPDSRESLLVYPQSWLRPSQELFDHDYQDSSSTFATWDQYLNWNFESSNNILAKYTPFSHPHRWSVGLQFINYSFTNPTKRSDVLLHYKNVRGDIEYFHTNNTQTINMALGSDTEHSISTHGLNFNYSLSEKFKLLGGINLNFIEQNDDTSRSYDINHEQLSLQYKALKNMMFYGKFHYWYWVSEDRQGPSMLFYPGVKINQNNYNIDLSLRISPTSIKPIAIINYSLFNFYAEAFTKVRSSRLIFQESGCQYFGVKFGYNRNSERLDMNVHYSKSQDVKFNETLSFFTNDITKFNGYLALKAKKATIYIKSFYTLNNNPRPGYYHPEISTNTIGLDFNLPVAKGKLILNGDFNAQYFIHEDPDNVSFNPSTLSYTRLGESNPVSDWQINFSLNAKVQTFLLSAKLAFPLDLNNMNDDFFSYGFKTSSDLSYGHGAYAGLSIQWLWWK